MRYGLLPLFSAALMATSGCEEDHPTAATTTTAANAKLIGVPVTVVDKTGDAGVDIRKVQLGQTSSGLRGVVIETVKPIQAGQEIHVQFADSDGMDGKKYGRLPNPDGVRVDAPQ